MKVMSRVIQVMGVGSDGSRGDESGDEDDEEEEDEGNEVDNDEDDISEIENEDDYVILAVISDHLEDETRCPTKTPSGRNITRRSEIGFSLF